MTSSKKGAAQRPCQSRPSDLHQASSAPASHHQAFGRLEWLSLSKSLSQDDSGPQVSVSETLGVLSVRRESECIIIDAGARSFLHNQVRSMVGALKATGEGTVSADDVQAIMESRDTALCPPSPPGGLVFMTMEY